MENHTADPSNNNIVRNWLSGIGIALLILVLITYLIHRSDSSMSMADEEGTSTSAMSGSETAAATTSEVAYQASQASAPESASAATAGAQTTASMGEAVTVADQKAGYSVDISDMTVARKSWVAIKDPEGSILGAGLFAPGTTSGTVSLLRATEAGKRYEAVIYVDDGDKAFELHKDMLVTGADGTPVSAAFSAQ